MDNQYEIQTEIDWLPVASQLLEKYAKHRIWCLYGDLGVGKTSLVKAICDRLGVDDSVSSPTFSLINQYQMPGEVGDEGMICHVDLYRLESLDEALDIGIEEILQQADLVLIEWPELVEVLLESEAGILRLKIHEDERGGRKMIIL